MIRRNLVPDSYFEQLVLQLGIGSNRSLATRNGGQAAQFLRCVVGHCVSTPGLRRWGHGWTEHHLTTVSNWGVCRLTGLGERARRAKDR